MPNIANRVAQNTTITINNINYKVRLLGGTTETQSPLLTASSDVFDFRYSEFNRLLYRTSTINYSQQIGNNFDITFDSFSDLGFNDGAGRGTICMDYNGNNTIQTRGRQSQGLNRMSAPYTYTTTTASAAGGWRPVLERIN